MTRPCLRCGEPSGAEPGHGCEATVGSVAGVIDRSPRLRCSAGHVLPAAACPATSADAIAQVRRAVPYARARRLRRAEGCSSCDEPLTMPVRRTDWPVTLERPGGLPVVLTIRLDVPATRCPGCGTDQVPTRSQGDLEATVRALLGAGAS
jgi:hypothetical protein